METIRCRLCGEEIPRSASLELCWCRPCATLRTSWRDLVLNHRDMATAWLREQAANLGLAVESAEAMYVLVKAAGEVCAATEALPTINAATVKERYDALWAAEAKLAEALTRLEGKLP